MSPYVEQIALLPDARIVLRHPDGINFRLITLAEVGKVTAEAAKAGYTIVGAVATLLDGTVNGASERRCGELVGRAKAVFMSELERMTEPEQSGDSLAWLENLWALEAPRS